MIGPEEAEQSTVGAHAAGGYVEEALLDAGRTHDGGGRKCAGWRRLVVDLQLQALAVGAWRLRARGEADRIVGGNLAVGSTAMGRRPGVAEQEDQLAGMLDRIAEI